jgi:phosphoglycerate dehydrogenase-like enzyme
MISSPLEPELAERVRALGVVDELFYDELLLPEPRYPNDHGGSPVARDSVATARWNAMLAEANVLYGYPAESSAGLYDALALGPNVRFVQGTSAGMGAHIRRAALGAEVLRRVRFASAAGVHAGMLAEFVFYGLLSLRKDARRLQRVRAQRRWEHFVMGELDGSRIAILGMGQIGCAIAVRARAFGMHVAAVTRTGDAHALADETYATAALREAAARCDALVVTLPLTDRTVNLVSAETLAALPAHGIVANVGRGAVVDNAALVAALQTNRLAGAVLDVFDPEPLPPENPLWAMDNVIFSPHTAALSRHENARIVELFCDNLERFASGRPLRNAVNLIEFY